jgi:hypothetical protein
MIIKAWTRIDPTLPRDGTDLMTRSLNSAFCSLKKHPNSRQLHVRRQSTNNNEMRKKVIHLFVLWFGFALLFLIIGVIALDVPKYFGLASRGVETQGVVLAKEPKNHSFIRYSYSVNQEEHVSVGSAGGINRSFDELKPGESVRIFYDPEDPAFSLLGDPKAQFKSMLRGTAFLTLLGPAFCLFSLHVKGWLPGDRREVIRPTRKGDLKEK